MKQFKFFKANAFNIEYSPTNLSWHSTGLMEGVIREGLVIFALDTAYRYILDNNLLPNDRLCNMLFILIRRLYGNKHNYYDFNHIQNKIEQIANIIQSPATRNLVDDFVTSTTIDIEAEIAQIVYNRLNWDE